MAQKKKPEETETIKVIEQINESEEKNVFENFSQSEAVQYPAALPVIPLKDTVIFPYSIYPVLAGRESTIKAINAAVESNKFVFLATQIDTSIEDTETTNLHKVGTVGKIIQVLRLPNGLIKVLIDGIETANVTEYHKNDFITAKYNVQTLQVLEDIEIFALARRAKELFIEYVNANPNVQKETLIAFDNIKEFNRSAYYICSSLQVSLAKKQKLLEIKDLRALLYEIIYMLSSEMEITKIVKEIDNKVYTEMQKNQRKFIVQEQIKILQDELGDGVETDPELSKIQENIEKAGLPETVKAKALEEYNKLRKTPTMSPDFSVTRNYLDWITSVPWNTFTDDNFNLDNAKKILDEDHYDLEKPKERIIELLAILKLLKDKGIRKPPKGQILCLVGPPGVGKTSLGKSIARALNRKFARLSVGGVRDEAEIRGHRRTYIGSMPGKIIQAMKKTGTCNPVILIDEIDKMGNDWRGDPASAMLEVLDPEQNNTFNDHYLDVDYDLSNVLFITTANIQYNIPPALQDRMEIIEMRSYLDFEKVQIAKRHIIPKELAEHGFDSNEVVFPEDIILTVIRQYTRESGVRNLEREITAIIRKLAKDIVLKNTKQKKITVTKEHIAEYLGVRKYTDKKAETEDARIGSVTGLAWTSMGGDILNIEVTIMKGVNKITLTGKLGDVMKESALAGLSYLKSNSKKFGIPENYFKDKEIHIHVPEGAIPKDGPSAGITMTLAMLSAILKKPARADVAMTGEITLRGKILPIGGLNEKMLAALRSGIKTVILPADNKKDLDDVPDEIKKNLNIVLLKNVDEGLDYIFNNKKKRKK